MDLLPLIPTGAAGLPCNSGPHLGIICTWLLCSTPEAPLDMMTLDLPGYQPDLVTLVRIWMSPGPGDSGTPLGLNQFW